jgi:hypothetical protein
MSVEGDPQMATGEPSCTSDFCAASNTKGSAISKCGIIAESQRYRITVGQKIPAFGRLVIDANLLRAFYIFKFDYLAAADNRHLTNLVQIELGEVGGPLLTNATFSAFRSMPVVLSPALANSTANGSPT